MAATVTTPRVYVIHDNPEWIAPLVKELEHARVPYTQWLLSDPATMPAIDFSQPPPEGVFFNRVSASGHTRGVPHAMEQAATLVRWLEAHGRRVLNGSTALAMEMSKSVTDVHLAQFRVPAPQGTTVFGTSAASVDAALRRLPATGRLVVKPNRGGSGAGVRILGSPAAVRQYFASDEFVPSVDGVTIVQSYVASEEDKLFRLEFVGGRLLYGVAVDTSDAVEGAALNNCPADSCDLKRRAAAKRAAAQHAMDTATTGVAVTPACPLKRRVSKFKVLPGFTDPIVTRLEALLRAQRVDVGAVEIIRGADGVSRVIDVNAVNSNFNVRSEKRAKVGRAYGHGFVAGWEAVVALAHQELLQRYPSSVAAAGSGAAVAIAAMESGDGASPRGGSDSGSDADSRAGSSVDLDGDGDTVMDGADLAGGSGSSDAGSVASGAGGDAGAGAGALGVAAYQRPQLHEAKQAQLVAAAASGTVAAVST